MVGTRVSHYIIVDEIGRGGMGIVYRADDTKLRRAVALKFLPESIANNPHALERFQREAHAASSLNHPNICTIYDIDEHDGRPFIAMELLEGASLSDRLSKSALSVSESLELGCQLADALDAAHKKGILHRDLKPANIFVTNRGEAKILDFGLAKLTERHSSADDDSSPATLMSGLTRPGTTMGTLAYMSPEQIRGEEADERSDIWALGVVLYQMLTGKRPFNGPHDAALIHSITSEEPASTRKVRPDIPAKLDQIIQTALQKNSQARYDSAAALLTNLRDLTRIGERSSAGRTFRTLLRPATVIPAGIVLAFFIVIFVRAYSHSADLRRASEEGIPEIQSLAQAGNYIAAFNMGRQVEGVMANAPELERIWPLFSRTVSIHTTPPGADVAFAAYNDDKDRWVPLGQSPLENIRIPAGPLRFRIVKPGHATLERALIGVPGAPSPTIDYVLPEEHTVPKEMVWIPQQTFRLNLSGVEHLAPVELDAFLIDRYEVTNKQFREFVHSDGYRRHEYWKQPFVKDGRTITFDQAMTLFRDATGRPGPASWELGSYPSGQDDYPVTGVSWYEAAAYAEFRGKSLPTIFHWAAAAGLTFAQVSIPVSNFKGAGSAAGSHAGMSPSGTFDMAGNAKEWIWNEGAKGRYILGGGWNEASYLFHHPDERDPFTRAATYGFRCVNLDAAKTPRIAFDPVVVSYTRDYKLEKPVSDDVFQLFRRLYSYDATPLNPKIQSTDDSAEFWRKEKIVFDAAYNNEKISAYLFLPKGYSPPYQAIVFFPGANNILLRATDMPATASIDFLIRSGRAVLWPVYKGTLERGDDLNTHFPSNTSSYRDHVIQWVKDFRRSVDYLDTRKDIDVTKLAYVGNSWGATMGAIIPALEDRLKASILFIGGFYLQERYPEVDQINFAPRIKIPVLMLNGRYDWIFPIETSQNPMFRFLGSPEKDKRHILFDTGHGLPRQQQIKETLDWLDKYLGPVK